MNMKKILLCTMLLLAILCGTSAVWGAKHKQQVKVENAQKDATADDTTNSSEPAFVDSVDQASSNVNSDDDNDDNFGDEISRCFTGDKAMSYVFLIPIIGTISGCLLIAVILFLVFYFRYKNRQAKYRLAEKALEAGKPLPEDVFVHEQPVSSQSKRSYTPYYTTVERDKGIRTTFLGLGLFIFLWALTTSFGVACIGLLVMFIGIGHWVSAVEHKKDAEMMNNLNGANKQASDVKPDMGQPASQSTDSAEKHSDNVNPDDTAAE